MRDTFERFGIYLYIDVMRSYVCNTKCFCYVAPVVKNEIGKINFVCEGFVLSETHYAYTFIFESLFQIFTSRTRDYVHVFFLMYY